MLEGETHFLGVKITHLELFTHSHFRLVISRETPKQFPVCHPVAPLVQVCLLTVWIFRLADAWLKLLLLLDSLQVGLPHDDHDLHDWHVLLAGYARRTGVEHVSPDWKKDRKILGPVAVFNSAPRQKWRHLGSFTGATWSHVVATPQRATAFLNTLR